MASIYRGWLSPESAGRFHLFRGGLTTAMPTYGESYGGGSSPTTYGVQSYCGKFRMSGLTPHWSLLEERPINACKLCIRGIKAEKIALRRIERKKKELGTWIKNNRKPFGDT